MSKSAGTYSISCLHLRITVKVNRRCNSCGIVYVRGNLLLSPWWVFIMCSRDSWTSVRQLLELSRTTTFSFLNFSRNCSVAVLEIWIRMLFGGDVWHATSDICLISDSWVVWVLLVAESLCLSSSLRWLTCVYGVCCQTTSEIIDNPVILAVSGLSHPVPEWRRGVFSLKLAPQPGHFQLFWSVCFVVDFDFVSSVFVSEEAMYLQHWLQNSITL